MARASRPAATRGLDIGHTGELCVDATSLPELVQTHGSPVHVVDMQAIDRNTAAVAAASTFSDIYSSYKTNPIPAVLERLHAGGVRAEIISPFEWWLTQRLDVPAEHVIYNGPAKSHGSLVDAAASGVGLANVNSPGDLDHLIGSAQAAGRPLRSGIRISLPHMWGGQFGIDGNSQTLIDTVTRALASEWMTLIAIHAHSGFPLTTRADVEHHVSSILQVVDRVHAATDWSPAVLDLGGSTTCVTLQAPDRADVISLSDAITVSESMITTHFAASSRTRPQLAFEPGKALTADTQFLLTTVQDVVHRDGRSVATLDVGVGLAEPLQEEVHDVFNASKPTGKMTPTQLVGPGTVGNDTLGPPVLLAEVAVGDVIAVMDTGAYFVPFSRAASHLRPAILSLDREAEQPIRVVRARENAEFAHRHDRSAVSE